MEKTFNTIVIGLGAVGSATTYQLAKQGSNVLGIDQFAPPHNLGSSHGDSRITREAIGEGAKCLSALAIRSNEIWRDLEQQTSRKLLSPIGGLIISSGGEVAHNHVKNFFKNTLESASQHDITHELLSASDIRKKFPQFNVADNENGYFEPSAGYLNADECVRTNIEMAKNSGANIQVNEKVLGFVQVGDLVRVQTNLGTYLAENLVVCSGPWIGDLTNGKYENLFRVTRQVLIWFDIEENYEKFKPGKFPVYIWELQDQDKPLYGFPAINGSSGGFKSSAEQNEVTTSAEGIDRSISKCELESTYEKYFAPYFKGMSGKIVRSITCLYTTTPDAQFIVDKFDQSTSITFVSPCSGHGFKHSAALGEAISQKIMTGKSDIDLTEFAISRFS